MEIIWNNIWINNNTDRKLDVVFSRFRVFFVYINPEAEAQRSSSQAAHALSLPCNSTLPALNSFWLLPQGYRERKPPKSWKDDIYCFICVGNCYKSMGIVLSVPALDQNFLFNIPTFWGSLCVLFLLSTSISLNMYFVKISHEKKFICIKY